MHEHMHSQLAAAKELDKAHQGNQCESMDSHDSDRVNKFCGESLTNKEKFITF